MTPDQFMLMKVLKAKQLNDVGSDVDLLDHFMKQEGNQEELRKQLKNLCAYVSPHLASEVEQLCDFLDITKREFIEKAIIDYVAKAQSIIEQQNLTLGAV